MRGQERLSLLPDSLLRVSISDFDVEPRSGSRVGVVLLGIASAIAGVLAIIGWPLPVISSTHGRGRHAWARTIHEVQDWFTHDGWRMSGASWIYGALAVVAAAAVVVLLHPSWSGRRALLIVVVPAGALLVVALYCSGLSDCLGRTTEAGRPAARRLASLRRLRAAPCSWPHVGQRGERPDAIQIRARSLTDLVTRRRSPAGTGVTLAPRPVS
jgi:hypothetical protein